MKGFIGERALKEEDIERLEEIADENEHIIDLWEPLDFNIDRNYEYVSKDIIFNTFSDVLYYLIAYPILKVLTKIVYDLKIEGRENIDSLEKGAISVSNHVLFLDCAMVGLAWGQKRVYYTTLEGSFKIPFVRKLIKLLRAMPIPEKIKNREYFLKAVEEILSNGDYVHFYPEAALFPYYKKIRNFKNGAFSIAVKNNVPIVPMVFIFREPKGIRKIFKKKKDVTLKILKPVTIKEEGLNQKQKEELLKNKVHTMMEDVVKGC